MTAHLLTTFLYETFGQQFGDLLLAGYGEEPGGKPKRLRLTESKAEGETAWVIDLVGDPPCREEPLVLAALLKLLLGRPSVSQYLEFDPSELLTELRWRDTANTHRQIEATLHRYVRLLYEKRLSAQVGQSVSVPCEEGYYHLLTGYIQGATFGFSGTPNKTLRGVYFDAGLIEGLKQGRVYFAGIDFGSLKHLRPE